jgi:hypothetical protein
VDNLGVVLGPQELSTQFNQLMSDPDPSFLGCERTVCIIEQ